MESRARIYRVATNPKYDLWVVVDTNAILPVWPAKWSSGFNNVSIALRAFVGDTISLINREKRL